MNGGKPQSIIVREAGMFLLLLFAGIVLVPFAVYQVGEWVFGDYGGGYGDFFRDMSGRLRNGNPAAWFLVLSPWIGLQCLRLIALAWRKPAA